MSVANRISRLPAAFTGLVKAVPASILILTLLGIGINWFRATVGLLIGGALAAALCGVLILLANIRNLLEESRAMETDSIGEQFREVQGDLSSQG